MKNILPLLPITDQEAKIRNRGGNLTLKITSGYKKEFKSISAILNFQTYFDIKLTAIIWRLLFDIILTAHYLPLCKVISLSSHALLWW